VFIAALLVYKAVCWVSWANNAKETRTIGITAMDGSKSKWSTHHDRMVSQLCLEEDNVVTHRNNQGHNDEGFGCDRLSFRRQDGH
jgi:hypothetical protein